jgi:hypothetical protein
MEEKGGIAMSKFYGKIGFAETQEGAGDRIGIDEDAIIEKPYYGDILRTSRRYEHNSDSVLDELKIENRISIVADAYARNNFFKMKYVQWSGALWNITNVEVERPRLILTIGGVYNGPTARLERNTGEFV